MGRIIPLEHEEQVAFFQYVEVMAACEPIDKNIYAVPNAAKRSKRLRCKMLDEGLKSGVPDICVAIPVGRYHGLYIEMKRKGNKPTKNQLDWLKRLQAVGYHVALCWSAVEAICTLKHYMRNYDFSNPLDS